MNYKSKVHQQNADNLKNHSLIETRKKKKTLSADIQITDEWILVKSYAIDILKVNKSSGAIYFDRDSYSKTTSELQNIIEKWLDNNGLQTTNPKDSINHEVEEMRREDLV
ncbi:MAG: hypothetical protein JHC35_06350 [Sulfuricurvum sp.]|jgi:hypothetical protein|uniref:hypothetical protein n=1 Tax=Sulfuricurvum sp. TaxID=2025608 RepID=UPI0025CBA834|nr:hypothetical protein [Sulfuricurvum sp.]MCI4406890.1 hypothetical protein [Sulfuricurvum sp.]